VRVKSVLIRVICEFISCFLLSYRQTNPCLLHFLVRKQPHQGFIVKIDHLHPIAPRVAEIATERWDQFDAVLIGQLVANLRKLLLVAHHDPEMPRAVSFYLLDFKHREKLMFAELENASPSPSSSFLRIEYILIKLDRLVDLSHFDGDVVAAIYCTLIAASFGLTVAQPCPAFTGRLFDVGFIGRRGNLTSARPSPVFPVRAGALGLDAGGPGAACAWVTPAESLFRFRDNPQVWTCRCRGNRRRCSACAGKARRGRCRGCVGTDRSRRIRATAINGIGVDSRSGDARIVVLIKSTVIRESGRSLHLRGLNRHFFSSHPVTTRLRRAHNHQPHRGDVRADGRA